MMADVLFKKVISEKDSWVFSHSRFKQFFVASGAYQEVDVAPEYTFCAVAAVCTWSIPTYRGICVVRAAPRVEYTLAANSADRSLINRSHYQATSECA